MSALNGISIGQRNAIVVADLIYRAVALCQLNVGFSDDCHFVDTIRNGLHGMHAEHPVIAEAFESLIHELRNE
jgi:hypothetical protein